MTLAELVQEVYTITGRPDRVAETSSAIRAATLKAHRADYFYKDLYENGIQFDSAEFHQQFAYRELVPRWRAFKYLRYYDAVGMAPGKFLTLVPPEMVLDGIYKIPKEDIVYVAGEYVQIKLSAKQQYFLLGCYLNPNITDAGYNSWIAIDHPYAIVFDAAATVFKAIGKDEEAAAYRSLVASEYTELISSNIVAEGF